LLWIREKQTFEVVTGRVGFVLFIFESVHVLQRKSGI